LLKTPDCSLFKKTSTGEARKKQTLGFAQYRLSAGVLSLDIEVY
jgi:hypothetical protein